jgi:hypothetical protein
VRAQIQSHGLRDIQARHCDRHGYMPEKRAALVLWVQRFRNLPKVSQRTASTGQAGRGPTRVAAKRSVVAGLPASSCRSWETSFRQVASQDILGFGGDHCCGGFAAERMFCNTTVRIG